MTQDLMPRYLYKRSENLHSYKNLYMNIYIGFTHSYQKLETRQTSLE